MTTSAAALTHPRARLVRLLARPGNILPAFVWLFLVFNQAFNSPFPPSPSTALLVLINSVALALFIVRRDPSRVGNKVEGVIALGGTFLISLLEGPEIRDTQVLPTVIQLVGLAGWAASLATLGRSFGVVPADRGLVSHGPYRFIRHPVYAFEFVFIAGYALAMPTPRTFTIIAFWTVLQIIRIVREERIISGYGEYRTAVRWRILPGVW